MLHKSEKSPTNEQTSRQKTPEKERSEINDLGFLPIHSCASYISTETSHKDKKNMNYFERNFFFLFYNSIII